MSEIKRFRPNEGYTITNDMKKCFDEDGYLFVESLIDTKELEILKKALENDEGIKKYMYGRDDGSQRMTKVALWNQPGRDVTGVVARCEKVAGTMAKLLGGEVYHYHSKVIVKDPHTGGMHVWHQDYGYWYQNGCLYPNMGTVFIAIDKAQRINGCLKILKGSHKLGRADHCKIGGQAGIDDKTMSHILNRCEVLHVEMMPGDALFFHSNVIHRSEQNSSPHRRMAFLVSYNRADNNPVIKHHHPFYTPLDIVPNSAIKLCNSKTDITGKDFFLLEKDISVKNLKNKESD